MALARGLLARSVLLNEPSLGLAVAQALFEALSRLRDEALTLLADLGLPLANCCAVPQGGRIGQADTACDTLNLEAA